MENILLKGAVTELMGTFDADEKLDLGMYRAQIDFQMEAGIEGLFCNGLSGESLYMTKEEKLSVTKATVEKAKGKLPIIGNIAEMRPCDAREMLDNYVDLGVDGICITQPYVFGYGNDAIVKFYCDLAQATDLPVYIYNAPQTNNTMSPAVVAKIVNNNDNVIGYKDSTQDIIHLQTLMASIPEDKHFECVAGSDATIFPTLTVGGCGIVSLVSAVFPQPIIDVCDAWFAGDVTKAFEAQKRVLEIRTALKSGPLLSSYKYAASLIGLELGYVRGPLVEPTEAQKAALKENLLKLGLVK